VLLAGNIFSYIVSPKYKLVLKLKEKRKIANDTYDFVFEPNRKMPFHPGQYLEWTLGHKSPDLRGNRRYFTIASSPTEEHIRLGVKFYPKGSTFKKKLLEIERGTSLIAGQLAGDFIMPHDKNKKLVFMAGGIGITPFRSMIKYLLDINERRDIVLIYSNYSETDIAYQEILKEAQEKLDLKIVHVLTNNSGPTTAELIKREVPDHHERHFYISGSQSMVTAFDRMLRSLGVHETKIRKDFFPGFV
jgi:ferredoxin-NADP reductase